VVWVQKELKKTNKILVENEKINTKIKEKLVKHLLQSSKHLCKIHRIGQISRMHHRLVFFPYLA